MISEKSSTLGTPPSAAWQKATPLTMITQAFRDDFGEIINFGERPPSAVSLGLDGVDGIDSGHC